MTLNFNSSTSLKLTGPGTNLPAESGQQCSFMETNEVRRDTRIWCLLPSFLEQCMLEQWSLKPNREKLVTESIKKRFHCSVTSCRTAFLRFLLHSLQHRAATVSLQCSFLRRHSGSLVKANVPSSSFLREREKRYADSIQRVEGLAPSPGLCGIWDEVTLVKAHFCLVERGAPSKPRRESVQMSSSCASSLWGASGLQEGASLMQ